ncbi:RecQ family ATP-dependent DNA helicase [Cellulomonas massiliensis]|uniref:RecQ family ATP-dependent DNA helicase n=1 Tax=Cellulomonas massiliensis TaxID=1465811 RepID=UPI00036A9982|nr:RecQ family ATP-dependent DNA helicase [Cellulomonas massiliensis]
MTRPSLDEAVARVLGPDAALRDVQSEALAGLEEHDTLLVARSGAGKTAVYAIATLLSGRLTLVVSPLLALQRDQVRALTESGLRAASVSSLVPAARRRTALRRAADGELDVLLLAPEQLARTEVRDALADADVGLVVVDEAHCVSEWGDDFRPDYLAVEGAVAALGGPRLLALTATASPRVRAEVVERLGMRDARVLVRDADRPEIWLGVHHRPTERDRDDEAVRVALEEQGATLVYARTHAHAERLAAQLTDAGRACAAYHGGLPARERTRLQDDFLAGRTDVMVATSAFGMGVDRADVRLVVHAGLPPSLDAYYQEVGRAGRDGQPARAVGVVLPGESGLNAFLAARSGPRPATVDAVLGALRDGATTRDEVARAGHVAARTASRTLAALRDVGAAVTTADGWAPGDLGRDTALQALRERAERRERLERSRAEMVRSYADTTDCRRRVLLELLGETHPQRCGHCDSCDAGTSLAVTDASVSVGRRVRHDEWGGGTVSVVEADRLTVLFDEQGYVTLDREIALDSGVLRLEDRAAG